MGRRGAIHFDLSQGAVFFLAGFASGSDSLLLFPRCGPARSVGCPLRRFCSPGPALADSTTLLPNPRSTIYMVLRPQKRPFYLPLR